MFSKAHHRASLMVVALLVTAACSDSGTGVDSGAAFDAARAGADLRTISDVLAGDVWASFRVLGEHLPIPDPPASSGT